MLEKLQGGYTCTVKLVMGTIFQSCTVKLDMGAISQPSLAETVTRCRNNKICEKKDSGCFMFGLILLEVVKLCCCLRYCVEGNLVLSAL